MNDSGGGMVRSVMLTLRHGTTGLAEVSESSLASKIEDKLGEKPPMSHQTSLGHKFTADCCKYCLTFILWQFGGKTNLEPKSRLYCRL